MGMVSTLSPHLPCVGQGDISMTLHVEHAAFSFIKSSLVSLITLPDNSKETVDCVIRHYWKSLDKDAEQPGLIRIPHANASP